MIIAAGSIIFLLVMPFVFTGIINKVKALWEGRKGAGIMQPFFEFIKLLQKGEVISTTSTLIFRLAPAITLASVITAGMLAPLAGGLPLIGLNTADAGTVSFVIFAYLLGTGRFFSVIGAMDTGSSFEGLGASREASFGALVEPAFFILLGTLALINGSPSSLQTPPGSFISAPAGPVHFRIIITVLTASALFIMLLTEGCRVPVDDPATHLELTMVHEVMALDNSGPGLAFLNYAAGMKMVIIASIIAAIILPSNAGTPAALAMWAGFEILAAVIVGTLESFTARLRMAHVFQFILVMSSLALIALSAAGVWLRGGLI